MLLSYLVFLRFCYVWSCPIPEDFYASNNDVNPSADVQPNPADAVSDTLISNDPNDPLYPVDCSSNVFTNELAESNPLSLNTDDFNLRRREAPSCRNRSGGNAVPTPTKPQVVKPDHRPILTAPSDEPCPDAAKSIPLTCAGPEAWLRDREILLAVGNCEAGKYFSLHDPKYKTMAQFPQVTNPKYPKSLFFPGSVPKKPLIIVAILLKTK